MMEEYNSNYDFAESNTTTFNNLILAEEPFINLNWPKEDSHFLCKKCLTTPNIEFKNNIIFLRCPCQSNEDSKISITSKNLNTLENYILFGDVDYIDNNVEVLSCKTHSQKFKYFCENCNKNLCEKCNASHDISHRNKTNFDIDKHKIKENIKNLIDKFELNTEKTKEISDPKNILKRFIAILIYDYRDNPNFILYRNLKNININEININLNEENKDTKSKLKIYSSRYFLGKIEAKKFDDLKLVQFIKIYQSDFHDISILSKLELINLIELDLKHNNIKNIKVLKKCNFPKLEKLYLDTNKIDDTNIKYISEFRFPELKDLSLKLNYFSNFEFFKSMQTFGKLAKLNIGSNKFSKETYKNENYNLNSIKEIILSNGVFNDDSIFILSKFKLENIEIVDLSCNNLSSLSFILNVNWPNLNKIFLSNNDIKEIEPLNNFKNLKFIEIYDNLINDIEKVKKIIDENQDLKINLSLTNIINDNISININNINNISTNINSDN